MKKNLIINLSLVIFVLAACQPAISPTSMPQPMATFVPTNTVVPPTNTPKPTVTPVPPTPIDPEVTLRNLCKSNVYAASNQVRGKINRYETPIDINPNGIEAVLIAIENIEKATSGAVKFHIVDSAPRVGIQSSEGDSPIGPFLNGCGSFGRGSSFQTKSNGVFNGVTFVRLGDSTCDYTTMSRPFRLAEHELGHALGLHTHFEHFTGYDGFWDVGAQAVLTLLYTLPPGKDMSEICPSDTLGQ